MDDLLLDQVDLQGFDLVGQTSRLGFGLVSDAFDFSVQAFILLLVALDKLLLLLVVLLEKLELFVCDCARYVCVSVEFYARFKLFSLFVQLQKDNR